MIVAALKENKVFLILIYCFSLLLFLLFFKCFLIRGFDYFRGDSAEYVDVAKQIVLGQGVSESNGELTYRRVPGYSFFLAASFYLFGFDLAKSVLFQIVFAAFIPILVFFLSLSFFPTNILLAKISAFLMAINLGTIIYADFLMSEALFIIFFLIFSILFFSKIHLFFDKNVSLDFSYINMFLAGIILGVASLIRPVGHLMLPILLLMILLSSLFFTQKIKSISFFLFGWFCIVGVWLIRNFLLTGQVFFLSISGLLFISYLGPDVYSKATGVNFLQSRRILEKEWQDLINEKELVLGKKLNDIQIYSLAENIAFKYVKKYPIQAIELCVINFMKTLFGFHCSVFLAKYSSNFPSYDTNTSWCLKIKGYLFPHTENKFLMFLVYYEILFLLLLYIGFLGCFFLIFSDKSLMCEFLKILPIIIFFVFITSGIGLARLRFPIEPFLIIFSSYFWIKLFKREIGEFGIKKA